MIPVHEKQLLDRIKDYASSVMVRDTPWLGRLMNDIIVELTENANEIERLCKERDEWEKQYFAMEAEAQRLKMIISG
jgi:hypothetical protein